MRKVFWKLFFFGGIGSFEVIAQDIFRGRGVGMMNQGMNG